MSKKEVVVCDGCGKIIEKRSERYKLYLKSDRFWNGIENVENVLALDFCYACALKIKETLERIAKEVNHD